MHDADTSVRLTANSRRGTASAALLTELAGEHGMPIERCLRGTGLGSMDLTDPDAEISAGQEHALIGNLVRELAHVPALGLTAGRRYHLTTYGLLGLAAISSATLGQAVEVGLSYLDLTFMFTPFMIQRTEHGLRATLDQRALPGDADPDVCRFLAEREMAATVTFVRDLIGPCRPISHLDFQHPEPSYGAVYQRLFGVRPAFGRPVTGGVLTAEALNTPLLQAEPHTAALSRRHCERRRTELRRPAPVDLAQTVRDRLHRGVERGEGIATPRQVAADLNLGERSLRRALHAEGTSFSVLATEVATALARAMLADGHTVETVADALGYASTSGFSHAFKRWTGATPGTFH
ncbi:AraC family transcriptional regulator [Actinophytocola oryzae]|uniref:AraC-like DNA-binding protein n=1 Tax=Actinophytocola oryzae TaxID=502181 RepID=A0A4R7UXS8_9PSEU|nr:AraC family transcriptional regulator [Actinophytocola oryzae]TDV41320.1 AraC-like DNA-binding protein [Actinophytocola oryzae]